MTWVSHLGVAASAQLTISQKALSYGACILASRTGEGPEPFGEDGGWEQAAASAVCLPRAHSLIRSEDYLENGRAKNTWCEIQGYQQHTPESAAGGGD